MNYETPQVEVVSSASELIQLKPPGDDDASGSGKSRKLQVSVALEAGD